MARLKRLALVGVVHHVVQRAIGGAPAFVDEEDHRAFLRALAAAAAEYQVALHAYVLLEQEFQLLATPSQASALGHLMQFIARRYVAAFNRRHGRTGTLWQGRFRAAPIEIRTHFLDCMRYVEQAPLRSGWGGAAVDYPWSSAAYHAGMTNQGLQTPVPAQSSYWLLGNTPFERETVYRRLLDEPLTRAQLELIERTTLKGWALGPDAFLAEIAANAQRPVAPRARGRPRKAT